MNELFAEGDLVEAIKDEQVIRNRIKKGRRHSNLYMVVGDIPNDLSHLTENLGFTLTLIEKATPPLPTEPGWYTDQEGDIWRVDSFARLWCIGSVEDDEDPSDYAPFTRLEPVAVTAKKVLEIVRDSSIARTSDGMTVLNLVLKNIADEFGVTS
jgi:hypothetical protein